MNDLKKWLSQATIHEKYELARRARTTVGYLRNIANESRKASAETAARIEAATKAMSKGDESKVILRGDLNEACRKCPYYKECLNDEKQ